MESSWPAEWPNIRPVDVFHVFDPNGDVLLQLHDLAPEGEPALEEELVPTEEAAPEEQASPEEEAAPEEAALEEEPVPTEQPAPEEEPASEEEQVARDDTSLFGTRRGEEPLDILPIVCGSRVPQSEGGEPLTKSVYLRVSSKHLIVASAVFDKMLGSDQFSEGQTLHSSGNLVMPLSDDSEALIILMHIVHVMTNSVPREVTLDTLTKLAILIDYYQLHEAVGFVSELWIADLKQKSFPRSLDAEVIPWLFISRVFSMKYEYAQLTQILEYESDDRLEDNIDNNLPIPASIIDRIQEHRIEAIGRAITIVHDHIATYLTSDILCSSDKQFDCDAIILGSLLKGSIGIGIWPRPEVPYCGMTFKNLASQVRKMRVLDQCSQDRYCRGYSSDSHGVMEAIEASMISLEGQFLGLGLDSFLLGTRSSKKSKKKSKKDKYAF
ncbi:hypothetical protein V496_01480 [Pseudogymnoascus sp. VKM F-4515 (FW-2607)]|nr:hypothetical protein V496_01480 [Pseudogymnoascus sp. VKM F-4515 (FW-2607)]